MAKITLEQQKALIKKCRDDILWFINECIINPYNAATGANFFITNQQKEALIAFRDLVHDKINGERHDILGVSIMSGKGTGKDASTVWVMLWFMFCFPFPKIPCISVSADQLNKVLWSEISKWLTHSSVKDNFVLQTEKLFRKDVEDSVRGKEWFAFTKAANPKMSHDEQIESLAGQHSEYMLQIIDEGSGVPNLVYETLEENMTQDCNLMWVIFNPMHAKGYAIDTQYKFKHRWVTFRWNSEDSEITNKEKHRRLKEDYGVESNTYRMNVLGLPPMFNEETLINWEWVMDAVDRNLTILPDTPMVMSLDCGAGGDNSIIASRRGNKVFPFKKYSTADSTELSNWAGHYIDVENPDVFRVDTIGIGWAIEGNLRDKKGSIVEAADSRRQADNDEHFINKRAEMFWTLRVLFERGTIEIPNDPDLLNQLAALKYDTDKRGRTLIMDKRALKKEIGSSPNEADALAMLFYELDTMISKKVNYDYVYRNKDTSNTTWMCG
jgi:phage terminase large subunit